MENTNANSNVKPGSNKNSNTNTDSVLLVKKPWSMERKVLAGFSIIYTGIILAAWIYAMNLQRTVATNNAIVNADARALIEVEKLRNLADSHIANARSYFLLGSKSLFEMQKKDKQSLLESLENFKKQFALPQIVEIAQRIEALELKQEEIFEQAMGFREKQTESKIVGQFYQSKVGAIRTQLNEAFDEIVTIYNKELERSHSKAKTAALNAEVQIPRGMTWFTGLITVLFLCMVLLILRMFREQKRQIAERDRLYDEVKGAIQARDEISAAISQDLKEPLNEIIVIAESLRGTSDENQRSDNVELIKSSIHGIESLIKDICDQKKSDMGSLTLRLDQIGIDEILDDARLMLQPLAKQRDIRLQFDAGNPPVLAFFDRERVIRVLWNLVGNAIKFSPKHSKVAVKVRSDQQFVHVSVSDSGPGIPEKRIPTIFDHFWQAKKTAEQGPGVGLAIVKTIVEAHGGTVCVDSHVGAGSTFTFSLPRRRPVGAHLKRPTQIVRHAVRAAVDSQEGNPHNVM